MIHKQSQVAREQIVVDVDMVGQQLIGTVTLVAHHMVSECHRCLPRPILTPTMNNCQ